MTVLYRFLPEDSGWETAVADSIEGRYTTSIGDSFDYAASAVLDDNWVYLYSAQTAPNLGYLKRAKFSFSVSLLPNHPILTSSQHKIADVGYADSLTPPYWDGGLSIIVRSDGKLTIGHSIYSSSAIAAGSSYDMELIFSDKPGASYSRLYVDGSLWVEDTSYAPLVYPYTYARIREGMGLYGPAGVGYLGPVSVSAHFGAHSDGQHVWTFEGEQTMSARWSMVYV